MKDLTIASVEALPCSVPLRSALGPDVALLADANCRYSVDDVRAMLPVLAEARAGWLEEPAASPRRCGSPPWRRRPACRSARTAVTPG
jgi:hypothetical protein